MSLHYDPGAGRRRNGVDASENRLCPDDSAARFRRIESGTTRRYRSPLSFKTLRPCSAGHRRLVVFFESTGPGAGDTAGTSEPGGLPRSARRGSRRVFECRRLRCP